MDIQDAAWETRPGNEKPPCTRATRLFGTDEVSGAKLCEILLGSNGQLYRHTINLDGTERWERLSGVRL